MDIPPTRYAKGRDGAHIAYQVSGEGPSDVVYVPGFVSHVELSWELPAMRRTFEEIGSYARLIRFDKRGTGLSDRDTGVPSLEQRMDDVRAVMDAVGSERAAIFGRSEGGAMSVLFAAAHPERTTALVLSNAFARLTVGPDQPWGLTEAEVETNTALMVDHWGTGLVLAAFASSGDEDEATMDLLARGERNAARPGELAAILDLCARIDVRSVLASISVPTLVTHKSGDRIVAVEHGRYLAEHIPGARYVEIESSDHLAFEEDRTGEDEVREFLTGTRAAPDLDRVLATVLFTDIVSSTERAAELGDRAWRRVLDEHDEVVRREIERFRGREVKSTGDGFLAVFDGPGRAAQCAIAATDAIRRIGLELRAGVHTGEIEQRGDDIGGITVHIGARVVAEAGAGEVLASRIVRDLAVGSPLRFEPRGDHSLKGVPGSWELFAVAV